MTDRYEHEIKDSTGASHKFSLAVEKQGKAGELVWPPEASVLQSVRRLTESRITAFIVWTTMKVRCWVSGIERQNGTDLEIVFASTPYHYRIEDGGDFARFIGRLDIPSTGVEESAISEQPRPPGYCDRDKTPIENAGLANCGTKVYVEDRSTNQQYAYYYIVNASDKKASATIIKTWMFEGQLRSCTKHLELYERQSKEVFSFPRNQDPKCVITFCQLS